MAQSSHAAVHVCRLADGSVVFQDTPCVATPKNTEQKTKKVSDRIPFKLHASWFDKPPVTPDRAICTKTGCHCDMFSRKYDNGLPFAIADALYMDGSWHRLESTLLRLDDASNNSVEQADLRKERDEAACNILMSQTTLKMYGEDVLRELRKAKRFAEDSGLDDPDRCDAGDLTACDYLDKVVLYNRIQGDIRAMQSNGRSDGIADTFATINNE